MLSPEFGCVANTFSVFAPAAPAAEAGDVHTRQPSPLAPAIPKRLIVP